MLLISYSAIAIAYCTFLILLKLSDLFLFALIIPIIFSTIFFQRRIYLAMLIIALATAVWMAYKTSPNFGNAIWTLLIVAATILAMSEVIYRLMKGQQQIEEALKKSEANLQALLNSNLQSFILIDPNYKIQAFNKIANEKAQQIFRKELSPNTSILDFVHTANLEGFKSNFGKALKGEWLLIEANAPDLEGHDNWSECSYSPVIGQNGQVTGVCFSVLDTNTRKKALEAVAQSEARFRALVQNSSDILTILEQDSTVRFESPSIETMLGYTPEFMRGKNPFDFVHPDDLEAVKIAFAKGQEQPTSAIRCEFRFRAANGEWLHLEAVGSNLLNDPTIKGIVVNTRDITARKQAEEHLRINEELYHTVTEISPVGLFRTDANGQCLYVSEGWCEITGMEAAAALGEGWIEGVDPDQRQEVAMEWEQAIKENRTFRLEYRCQHPSTGATIWVLGQSVAEKDKNGTILSYIGTITNINLRKQTEELLRVESQYLEALHETALGLMNRLELPDSLHTIITRAGALLGTTHGYIMLVDEEAAEPEMVVAIGTGFFTNQVGFRVKSGVGMAGKIWQSGQPVIVNDYARWEGQIPEFGTKPFYAIIGVPLSSDNRIIGVIALAFKEKNRQIGDEEIERLSQFAQLASITLDNARLYTASRRRLAELTTVQHVAKAINSSLRLEEVFETVVDQISKAFGYEMVSIYLREGDGLALQACVGYDKVISFIGLNEGVSGRVASTGQPAFVQNATQESNFLYAVENVRQSIMIPLKAGSEQVLGMLAVESKGKPKLTEEDFILLQLLADQVSVAVENAHLFVEQRQSEEKYRDVVDSVKEVIFKIDTQGYMSFLNPAWEEITAYSVQETLGTSYLNYVHFADHRFILLKFNALFGGEVNEEHMEVRLATKEGLVKWMEVFARRIVNSQNELIAITGTLIDITARKQAEDERLLLERKLLETQKLESLGVLAGGIAHDFNNLLVGILGNAELARLELPSEAKNLHETIEQIEIAAQRAADLTRQMLAYSGRGRFVIQRLDFNQLIEEMGQLVKASIKKTVSLQYQLSPDLPEVEADATQLRQVVMNLIVNASDAIGDNEGNVTVSSGVVWADQDYLVSTYFGPDLNPGHYVYFEVADSGCGIDKATLTRIFDPFFTTKFTGRGLGLAAVLGIVRGHKGTLNVVSEPGHGTTFRILLPAFEGSLLKKPELPTAGNSGLQTETNPPLMANQFQLNSFIRTILVVDDEGMVRNMTRRILERFGFRVITARDGREGVDIFCSRAEEIDCVLLDLTMPQLSGEEALREIKLCKPEAKVVLMSGFSEQEATQRFSQQGLAGFLQKPFTMSDLREAINEALSEAMLES